MNIIVYKLSRKKLPVLNIYLTRAKYESKDDWKNIIIFI